MNIFKPSILCGEFRQKFQKKKLGNKEWNFKTRLINIYSVNFYSVINDNSKLNLKGCVISLKITGKC